MQTNAEKGRRMFYEALKSLVGASASSQSAQQEPIPLQIAPPLPVVGGESEISQGFRASETFIPVSWASIPWNVDGFAFNRLNSKTENIWIHDG
ncbi:hypothetical protein PIB30_079043 [Stylosanthes scabra]|uniref:Uncharacterized protein n=1 Tax=Stylosanthes scabra TaxID=79078 RepID=A0ABU6RQS4_9FABA|nr:hypothetical protein [Stylosanthes scabra]